MLSSCERHSDGRRGSLSLTDMTDNSHVRCAQRAEFVLMLVRHLCCRLLSGFQILSFRENTFHLFVLSAKNDFAYAFRSSISMSKGQFCIFENLIIMLQVKGGERTFNIYRISCSEDYGYIKIFGVKIYGQG